MAELLFSILWMAALVASVTSILLLLIVAAIWLFDRLFFQGDEVEDWKLGARPVISAGRSRSAADRRRRTRA